MKIYTIGFTKTTAEHFFNRLRESGTTKLIDVRLNNVSQLAGFAKRDDLAYFLREIGKIGYEHVPALAPSQDMLDEYKKNKGKWSQYEKKFLELMTTRHIENLDREGVDGACLLCSEAEPYHCHRRLVAEYWKKHWGQLEIEHL